MKKFKWITSEVIIVSPTIMDEVEENKRRAIKAIMAIVDTQVEDVETHKNIRKAVLDSVNDLSRDFAVTLDRVVDKYKLSISKQNQTITEMTTTIKKIQDGRDGG